MYRYVVRCAALAALLAGCATPAVQNVPATSAASPTTTTAAPATSEAPAPSAAADADARLHALLAAGSLPNPDEPAYEVLAASVCRALDSGVSYAELIAQEPQPPLTQDHVVLVVYAAVFAYCPEHQDALPPI